MKPKAAIRCLQKYVRHSGQFAARARRPPLQARASLADGSDGHTVPRWRSAPRLPGVADNLPNDPRIHEPKRVEEIFFKNFMDARVNYVILPVAQRLLRTDQAALCFRRRLSCQHDDA